MLEFVSKIPGTRFEPKTKTIVTTNRKFMKLIYRNNQDIKFEALFSALIPLGFALDTLTTFPYKYVSCAIGLIFSACCVSFALNVNHTQLPLPFVALDLINNFILVAIAYQAAFNNSTLIFVVLNFIEDLLQSLSWYFSKKLYLEPWQVAVHEEGEFDEEIWDTVPYNLRITLDDQSQFFKRPSKLEQFLANVLLGLGFVFVLLAYIFQQIIQVTVCASYFKQVSVLEYRKFHRLLLFARTMVSSTLLAYVSYYYAYSQSADLSFSFTCSSCQQNFCLINSPSSSSISACYMHYEFASIPSDSCWKNNNTYAIFIPTCQQMDSYLYNYSSSCGVKNYTEQIFDGSVCELDLPIFDGYFLAIAFCISFAVFLMLRMTIYHPSLEAMMKDWDFAHENGGRPPSRTNEEVVQQDTTSSTSNHEKKPPNSEIHENHENNKEALVDV